MVKSLHRRKESTKRNMITTTPVSVHQQRVQAATYVEHDPPANPFFFFFFFVYEVLTMELGRGGPGFHKYA